MSQAINLKSIKKIYRRKRQPTVSRIAELAQISHTYLSLIISGKRVPPPETEDRIIAAYAEAWEELEG